MDTEKAPFRDIGQLRSLARSKLSDGALTPNYGGDVAETIDLLNDALATELVCVLRYKFHYFTATGLNSEGIKVEFLQHAIEEQAHADLLAARINELGGKPNMDPATFGSRSATEYREGKNLVDMIAENLIAERVAVEVYRDLVRFFGDRDPTTRRMIEGILAQEEEHANDMHDLLVAHEGKSPLK
ncbi:MAG TPA: ferritin-like domain-containing protein [Polyangiaceae bacterium]|jgi:bacterioferritin|nr:ferritin-like domain-containing protein [Polyangiaceae bacterium]